MGKRNFKSPREMANTTYINPAKLEAKGVILEGTYIEATPNRFGDGKFDYKFSDEKGNTIVLNGAGNIAWEMKPINVGDFVRINYKGRTKIAKGTFQGKMAHTFEVLRDEIEKA